MKFEATIYVNREHYLSKLSLEKYLVGNGVEYKLTRAGNFKAWLTKPQIEQIRDDGFSLQVW